MTDKPGAKPARVKCLLVDDLQENLLALSALLRRDDVEILQARSGPEALELLLAHDIALALIDVQMPDMDGFELAELMRGSERTRGVPIIFVTAGARDQQRIFKGYDAGAVDFLFKPIEAHILRSKAEVFFQIYRQKQELALHLKERTETLRLSEMFMAVLGHDLRSPLSAIMMSAQLLAARPDEPTQKVGVRLQKSGRWMGRMIEDMLDLARSRVNGGIPLARQSFDMGALVERVVHERQAMYAGRLLNVTQQGNLIGYWDEDRMVQVVSNLVGNALHHGDAAAPVEVRIDGAAPHALVLSVANAGSIPADVLPTIFDPFRSGRKQTTRSEGLGLGLYIAQQIVRAHQGSLDVESSPGRLTVFRVSVPRGSPAMPPAQAMIGGDRT